MQDEATVGRLYEGAWYIFLERPQTRRQIVEDGVFATKHKAAGANYTIEKLVPPRHELPHLRTMQTKYMPAQPCNSGSEQNEGGKAWGEGEKLKMELQNPVDAPGTGCGSSRGLTASSVTRAAIRTWIL